MRVLARCLVLACVVLAACTKGRAVARNDGPDAEATSGKSRAHRIVSLSPSTTEALFAIGASDAVVGRSRFCDFPPEAASLPQVGGFSDPNFEAILALAPDLVVGGRGPAGEQLLARLTARGIPGYFPETESLAQIDAMLLEMGARTGRGEEARRVVDSLRAREDETSRAVRDLPRPKVLMVFGLAPIVVAGPKSFANELIAKAGGENVVRDGGGYPTVGMEQILFLDPDIVVNATMAEARGEERIHGEAPGWRALRAVKEGHVLSITDESLLRPGPRIADALSLLAKAIHPSTARP